MLVGIVGTGLIGSSIGLASRAAGYSTIGWDDAADAAAQSAAKGAIATVAPSLEWLAERAEVIVLAPPLAATLAVLRRFPPARRARLVIDVASVKVPVVAAAAGVPSFVPSHPIAGSERSGPAGARADLFAGRTWAYVPPAERALEARAVAFFAALGARPLSVEAARHDAVVALTSHLPQIVATALGAGLAGRLGDPLTAPLTGGGMRDMTRLASSSWSVWRDVLAANSRPLGDELRAFAGILRDVAEALADGNGPRLAEYFSSAAWAAGRLRENEGAPSLVNRGTNDAT